VTPRPIHPGGASRNLGVTLPLLCGAMVALTGAIVYVLYQLTQVHMEMDRSRHETAELRRELAQASDQLLAEIGRVRETSTQTNKSSIESLTKELAEAQRQSRALVGQAKVEGTKHVEELTAKLAKMQEDQEKNASAVTDAVSKVQTDADATKLRVGEVSSEVGNVKTELKATKSELEKTVAGLRRTEGDLGMQSGLIATNGKELAALREIGDRNYIEFSLPKEKAARKLGDIQVRLKAADPKKGRYSIDVIADDRVVERKDKSVNEPVQFILTRSPYPYELVVNEIKKDLIFGYLSSPKVRQARTP